VKNGVFDIIYRIPKMVHPLVEKLGEIYNLQANGNGYPTFDAFFSKLELLEFTRISGSEMYKSIPKHTMDGRLVSCRVF